MILPNMDAIVAPTVDTAGAAAMQAANAELVLSELEVWVHLGCSEAERSVPQPVHIDATIHFAQPPEACRTDRLNDSVCYAELATALAQTARSRPFLTVERLAQALAEEMRRRLPQGARLRLDVTKSRAPVPGLRGGVRFTLEG
jgi:dihydroneopterin aldolase